jgi:hypothetical protein
MKPKVKSARRSAAKLHGATATYVSLVDRGANETPFTLVKNHKGTPAMSIKKRTTPVTSKKSHKTVGSGKKAATANSTKITDMAKMVFSGDNFADEQAVLTKLVEMEWTDDKIAVTKNDDGDWVARLEGSSDDDYDRIEEVPADDEGVTAFVGTKTITEGDEEELEAKGESEEEAGSIESLFKEGEDDDEESDEGDDDEEDDEADADEEDGDGVATETKETKAKAVKPAPKSLSKRAAFIAAKAADREKVSKFDQWDAMYSPGNTLAQTLKAGIEWDGLPPGYHETQIAFSGAMSNIMGDEGLGAGKQAALNKCASDFAEIVGSLDTYFDNFIAADPATLEKSLDDGQRTYLNKWAEDYAVSITSEPAALPKAVAKSAPTEENNEPAPMQSIADLIAKAVEPLQKQVEAVSGALEQEQSRRPSKKASDPDDGSDGRERSTKAAEPAEDDATWARSKQTKGLLG